MKKKLILGYVRVSTDKQAISVEAQTAAAERRAVYINEVNGFLRGQVSRPGVCRLPSPVGNGILPPILRGVHGGTGRRMGAAGSG